MLECEWTSVRVRECKTERESERESVKVLKWVREHKSEWEIKYENKVDLQEDQFTDSYHVWCSGIVNDEVTKWPTKWLFLVIDNYILVVDNYILVVDNYILVMDNYLLQEKVI